MSKSLQAIRGMNDILPDQSPLWRYFEGTVAGLLDSYGYSQIRTPIVEFTELFKRSIGEVTDIVEKEMYTFQDNKDSLTLRPEGTAACVRAVLEHGIIGNGQVQKLWYVGPMFRHERPQLGRYRQFHQIGVEVFNLAGPDIDAELIMLTWRLWALLGIQDAVTLELNSLGTSEARATAMHWSSSSPSASTSWTKTASAACKATRCAFSTARTKAPRPPWWAPKLEEYLDEESRVHFEGVKARLDAAGIPFVINTKLVRGLDYYSKTVFEWVTDKLGAQGTVCAGGRYDGLVEQMGGKPTTGVGFAMGIERLLLLIETLGKVPESISRTLDVYLCAFGEQAELAGLKLSEQLRDRLPKLRLAVNAGGGNFKNQFKKADKSGALFALILGDDELAKQQVGVKPLRGQGEQQNIAWDALAEHLETAIAQA